MSTSPETLTEVHYDPDCNPEQLEQVLSALDHWSHRTARHVTHKRRSDRHSYRSTVIVEPPPGAGGAPPLRTFLHVTARNVSKTGLGIVAPPIFMPRIICDDVPLLRSEVIFRVGAQIQVRLQAADRPMLTLRCEVQRLRLVHYGFFDIGVHFLGRDDTSQEATLSQSTTNRT